MEKIEKLEGSYDVPQLKQKLNEIIDYLNTQPQTEEKEVNQMYDFNERKVTTYIVDKDKVITILRQDEMPEWLKKGDVRVFKDTPEQKEGGSYVLTYKNLKEIMTSMEEQGTSTVSIEYLMQYCGYPIKNLLSEREEFTKDELFMLKLTTNDIHNKGNSAYDEIGKKINRMLSNLSSKFNGRE